MLKPTPHPVLLRGRAVRADGTASERYLLLRDGRIVSVSRRRPPRSNDATYVETGPDDWIFPGLLDLHTHSSYNLLPLWEPAHAPYDNRFGWRRDEAYRNDVSGMSRYLQEPHEGQDEDEKAHRATIAAFAEIQAVAGGTTTLQETYSLEQQETLAEPVLCRSTANPSDLGLAEDQKVFSVVDFFRPDDGDQPQATNLLAMYEDSSERGELHATLAHLAEGRSGFGSERGVDPYSRSEVAAMMAHPAFADAERVKASRLALVHGCGLDVDDEGQLDFLRERGISVIWSPVSNLLLYHETLDVEKLVAAGINVALGSDWSPSGSKHVWEEAKFARFYFEAIGSAVSDVQVFQMITINAARSLGTPALGRIDEGAMADLFILGSPLEPDNALEVFFKTTDKHVRAVFVNGVPLYGARGFLESFPEIELQNLPEREGSAVRGKAVHLPGDLMNSHGERLMVDRDITHLEELMKAAPAPLKPTKRSNLLASSDAPYRDRILELRKFTIEYGRRLRKWRRKA